MSHDQQDLLTFYVLQTGPNREYCCATTNLRQSWKRHARLIKGGQKFTAHVPRSQLRFLWVVQGFTDMSQLRHFERRMVMPKYRMNTVNRIPRAYSNFLSSLPKLPINRRSSRLVDVMCFELEQKCAPGCALTIKWFNANHPLVGCFSSLDSDVRLQLYQHTPLPDVLIDIVLSFRQLHEVLATEAEKDALYFEPTIVS